ncbi:MAG: BrnA antitoxin family protein [Anaerolineales bacterium]
MKKKSTSTKSKTDLERLDKMKDEDIDLTDIPEITPEMFAKAIVRRGLKPRTKKQVTLRVDSDVLEWYKKQGRGYQTKINLLLRAYMNEHRSQGD